jgi:hypothetical protein
MSVVLRNTLICLIESYYCRLVADNMHTLMYHLFIPGNLYLFETKTGISLTSFFVTAHLLCSQ